MYRLTLLLAALLALSPVQAMDRQKKQATESSKTKAKETTYKGLFGVVRQGSDWFFDVPDSLLTRRFLVTVRYTSTPGGTDSYGGELTNQQTVYFELGRDNQMLLRTELLINVADSTDNINRAILISNENPIIGTFKIEHHRAGARRVKVTQFFNEDNPALSVNSYAKQSLGLQSYQAAASYIDTISTYPLNTEVRTVKTWNSTNAKTISARETGKVTLGLNVSFRLLPEKPMLQRLFDPRVGYFTDSYNTYTDQQQRVTRQRFITRWRLEPKDSADAERMRRGELIEPKKPIVYYIDPATPKQWRKYLIQGVNDWQVAFERAGFKNAIRGEEWPERDSTMSMEDSRYSVIRYLASPIPNAYGPQVHDPRSGEILESHICWYHNVMKLVHDWYMIQAGTLDQAAQRMHYDTELMGQLIRFVSSHEVGHTLGLRHNFGSSSTVPVDSLRDKTWVEAHGHTPSIMDYARFNYVAQPEDGITHEGIFPRINDYDLWAIEWGYRPMLDAYDGESDHYELEKLIAQRLPGKPRLWFGDGETNRTRDSRCQTEDLGDDAVKASEYGILNLKRELKQLPEWTYAANDIYNTNISDLYNEISSQFQRYCGHVIGYLGGVMHNFKTVDETGDRYENVSRERQLDALAFLTRHILNEPAWLRSQTYIKRISPDPNALTQRVGTFMLRRMLTLSLLNAMTPELPAEEYLERVSQELFREIATGTAVQPYRRALQTTFVEALCGNLTATSASSPARGATLLTLTTLQRQLAAAHPADRATRAHCLALSDAVRRALEVK